MVDIANCILEVTLFAKDCLQKGTSTTLVLYKRAFMNIYTSTMSGLRCRREDSSSGSMEAGANGITLA
jgi:hypothetical protein